MATNFANLFERFSVEMYKCILLHFFTIFTSHPIDRCAIFDTDVGVQSGGVCGYVGLRVGAGSS